MADPALLLREGRALTQGPIAHVLTTDHLTASTVAPPPLRSRA
ncbi:hypothetical protein NQP46_24785 [Streptomyces albus]|nr:hypothetical protein NQP46_24785 [Streptomyces albus]